MIIKETPDPRFVLIDCPRCGNLYQVSDWRDTCIAETVEHFLDNHRLCETCSAQLSKQAEESRRRAAIARHISNLPLILEENGFPENYIRNRDTDEILQHPPCLYAAKWIWNHRNENLLISGKTGSGKSTSACFVAMKLVARGMKIHYAKLREFLAKWRAAKTSDKRFATERFLAGVKKYDIYILDEVAGKVGVTVSGQEVLFEILESINDGSMKTQLWLLGNFYTGSLEEIFSDAEPVRRRLAENFTCVLLDRETESVKNLEVYKGAVR